MRVERRIFRPSCLKEGPDTIVKNSKKNKKGPRVAKEKGKSSQTQEISSAKPSKKVICKSIIKSSRKKCDSIGKKTKFNLIKKIIPDNKTNSKTSCPPLTERKVLSLDVWNTSLHAACLLHYSDQDILKIVRSDNSLFFRRNGSGDLPLHYACMDQVGVSSVVLNCLLLYHPCAVRQWNSDKCLPLHLSCMIGAPSHYAVTCLLKLYPEAVMDQCEFPLTSIGNESSITNSGSKFFDTNSGKFCDSPGNEDIEGGWSPLHLAIMNNVDPIVINAIIEADTRCVYLKTSKGRTALDCGITVMNLLPNDSTNSKVTRKTMKSLNILRSYIGPINVAD